MVAVGALDDDLATLGAPALLDQSGNLQRGVDSLGSRATQEGPSVGVRRPLHDHLSDPGGGTVGERSEGVVRLHLVHLSGDGVDDLGTSVSDLTEPEVGHGVDIVLAGGVVDERALAADDVDEVALGHGRWGKRVEQGVGH